MKRCGKSAPASGATPAAGNPHPEQGQAWDGRPGRCPQVGRTDGWPPGGDRKGPAYRIRLIGRLTVTTSSRCASTSRETANPEREQPRTRSRTICLVTEDVGGSAPRVPALDELLLEAKLSVPPPRPGTVSRAALIETARSSDCRVIAVTAPAGYGKSTLLAEWALAEDRPVAWVTLDRFDDDPAVLLTVLASAYARVAPGQRRARRRHGRSRRLGAGARRASPRFGLAHQPGPVRAHAGRPARAAVARLSRRLEHRDLGDRRRQPAGRGEPGRAAPPATAAELGRRAGARGQRPGPRCRGGRADLLAGQGQPRSRRGCRGDGADRGLAGRPPPGGGDRERERRGGAHDLR